MKKQEANYFTLDYPIKILQKWQKDMAKSFPICNYHDHKSVSDYNFMVNEIMRRIMAINKAIKILEKENRIELFELEKETINQ